MTEISYQSTTQPDALPPAGHIPAAPALSELVSPNNYDPSLYGDLYHLVDYADGTQGVLQLVSFTDNDPVHNPLIERILESRRDAYIRAGWWEADHPLDDVRGPNVEFLALVDPTDGTPLVSLRKVSAPAGELDKLPCFSKFQDADAFDQAALAEFNQRIHARPSLNGETSEPRVAVEICCLCKDDRLASASGRPLLEAEAMKGSFLNYEVWFIAMVAPEHRASHREYGRGIHDLGGPITVDEPHTTHRLRLRAVWIDPLTFYDEIVLGAESGPDYHARQMTRGKFLGRLAAGTESFDPWQQKKMKGLIYD